MSGVASPAKAVSNFSCAEIHGICWTSTRMPGLSRSNSGTKLATTSPSRPIAQKRTTSRWSRSPHPASRTRSRRTGSRRAAHPQPAAGEAGPLEPAPDVRIAAHHLPDEAAAVIFDHRQDRPLVDAEIIGVVPAPARHDPAVDARHGRVGEARIERVEEAVLPVKIGAVIAAHRHQRGNRELRREGDRAAGRGRRDRAVVELAGPARRVGAEDCASVRSCSASGRPGRRRRSGPTSPGRSRASPSDWPGA